METNPDLDVSVKSDTSEPSAPSAQIDSVAAVLLCKNNEQKSVLDETQILVKELQKQLSTSTIRHRV